MSIQKTKTTSKFFFASLIIHLIGFLILNLIFKYSPPQYRGSDPLSKETMSPVEILFEMPKKEATEQYTSPPEDISKSLRKTEVMRKVSSIQRNVPSQNASEIPILMAKPVLPSFQDDVLEKTPQLLAEISVKIDIADLPDIQNIIPKLELVQVQTPSFPKKTSLPYSDIQWYPVYGTLDIIRFTPSVVPACDVGRKVVPKWLEEAFSKKEEKEIALVFIVNILKDMKAKLPALREYIYSIAEDCQKYYPNLPLGLVHTYHFNDGTTKYYGLAKNIAEFNKWLDDMVDAASFTLHLQNSRATISRINWGKIFDKSGQSLGSRKILIWIYDWQEQHVQRMKVRDSNLDESCIVWIHQFEYLDVKPKIKIF